MHQRLIRVSVALALAAAAMPAAAHHGFDAVFDAKKPVTVTGTVTRIDWGNPHIWFHLDVRNDKGTPVPWSFEGHSPNLLVRVGWKKTTLRIGDEVVVTGARARDGSNRASTNTVTRTDGTVIYKGLGDTVAEK